MAVKKTAVKEPEKKLKKAAKTVLPPRTVNLQEHCEEVRGSLIALYKQSKSATHPGVQGTLREGFIKGVLGGFLGRSASWSTGQIVGLAPKNEVSGQMDLLLHDDLLPQVYMFNALQCFVPSEALFGVIEVKSDLTTGVDENGVLTQALDSLYGAVRAFDSTSKPKCAFVIAAFYSGQKKETLVKKIEEFISRRNVPAENYWPDAVVVLSGGKTHPKGMGLFRERLSEKCGTVTSVAGLREPLWVLDNGGDAIAGLVALLSKYRIARSVASDEFDFAAYIFREKQESGTSGGAAGG